MHVADRYSGLRKRRTPRPSAGQTAAALGASFHFRPGHGWRDRPMMTIDEVKRTSAKTTPPMTRPSHRVMAGNG